METTVGIKQLHKEMGRIARRVSSGERILVMKHAKPLFVLIPYIDTDEHTHRMYAPKYRLADLGKLKAKGGYKTISREIDKVVYGL